MTSTASEASKADVKVLVANYDDAAGEHGELRLRPYEVRAYVWR